MNTSNSIIVVVLGVLSALTYQYLRTYDNTFDAATVVAKYGPWAVVLGASEGLGAAWSDLFCSQGLNVVIVARRQEALQERKEEMETKFSCQVETVALDLAKTELVTWTLDEILQEKQLGLFVC